MNQLQGLTIIERVVHIAFIVFISQRMLVIYRARAMSRDDMLPLLFLIIHELIYCIASVLTLDLGIMPIIPFHGSWAGALRTHIFIVILFYMTKYMQIVGMVK